MKKITRSSNKDSMIGGVCGGLAKHFQVDPFYFRAGFLLLFVLGLSGGLIYFICYLSMANPKED